MEYDTIDEYKKKEPYFGNWYISKKLGEGSFGKVFEIRREDFAASQVAALKVITIPQSSSEIESLYASGMDKEGTRGYYWSFVQEVVGEVAIMSKLKGNTNIVSYEDHMVIPHEDGIGWDILIRMELLIPLVKYIASARFGRQEIAKIGIDICKALEVCSEQNIIHRDIKPENIFISSRGDFKLGDFGIARTIEETQSGLSRKGTYNYMAPEVYKGEKYDSSVDLYSLGLVLYKLLNNNRGPFLPAYPQPIMKSDTEIALQRRFTGETLPKPVNADEILYRIILRATAYNPELRYRNPALMRRDLERYVIGESFDPLAIFNDGNAVNVDTSNKANKKVRSKEKKKKKSKLWIVVILLLAVLAVGGYLGYRYLKNESPQEKQYREAKELLDDEEYDEAKVAFLELDGYKDSEEMALEADYRKAKVYYDEKKYYNALKIWEELGDYSDSKSMANKAKKKVKESGYDDAVNAYEKGNYEEAIELFTIVQGYEDADDYLKEAKWGYVNTHKDCTDEKTYEYLSEFVRDERSGARELFNKLYAWKVTVKAINNDKTDMTNYTSLGTGNTVYFHVELTGGKPGQEIKIKWKKILPDGREEMAESDNMWKNGSKGTIEVKKEKVKKPSGTQNEYGQIDVQFYDDNNRNIGSGSIRIVY